MTKIRWQLLLLKGAVSAGLLYLVSRHASTQSISTAFSAISIERASLALCVCFAVTLCVAFRWRTVTSVVVRPMRFSEGWAVTMIGAALDQLLVTMSGEAYRIWWLRKGAQSLAHAIAGVILDRAVGMLGLVLLLAAFLPRFAVYDPTGSLLWLPAALVGTTVAMLILVLVLDRMPWRASRIGQFSVPIVMASSARIVFLTPSVIVPALGAGILAHVGICLAMSVLAWACGISLPFGLALTVIPPVMLVSLLPISIGGWGVREGAMVLALGLIGVQSAQAFVLSVSYGVIAAIIGATGGVVWLLGYPNSKSASS